MVGLLGVSFRLDGERLVANSEHPLTDDDRDFIREHKAELMAEIKRHRRRDELLLTLADNPAVRYAYTVDTGADPVIVAVGIRNLCTFEMTIPADRYDPFAILQLFEAEP